MGLADVVDESFTNYLKAKDKADTQWLIWNPEYAKQARIDAIDECIDRIKDLTDPNGSHSSDQYSLPERWYK